jgi:type I restriction enzyme R subunit
MSETAPPSKTEADARIVVDDWLREAGWNPADKGEVLTEVSISGPALAPAAPGAYAATNPGALRTGDGDTIPTGRADYVLLDQKGHPLAVIEAKRHAIHPYTAKQQVLPYAQSIKAPFIFLTNGELIYFWDYTNDDARMVSSFFSRRDLERLVYMRRERKPMATVPIPEHYLRAGEVRELRPYQRDCMKALDQAVELGKRRFLVELPTGTGKTDLTVQYVKRLVQAGRAERVLFLVDREQLARQAIEAFQDLLPEHSSYWLQPGMAAQQMDITVCLLQTMIGRYREFTSGYFDVVVADECHRSIYGSWQMALTHFDAFHLGLTATPASYIERNTFRFYQCKQGQPDFAFPITEAFKAGWLVPYKFAKGITVLVAEGAKVDEEHYDPAEFERKWTNADTNRKMMAEFDRLAWETYRELAPGQKVGPGKTIVFAITKHHAARLAEALNALHPDLKGRYAQVITSDVPDANDLIRRFKREDYPQVAVTVGMLDTGFDCREVIHLVMCRRVRSPILYQQMRGRGTRTCPGIGKRGFVIYDFFRNHEYFNDSETDIFSGAGGTGGGGGQRRPPGENKLVELGLEDEWLEAVTYVEVGPEGERFDKQEYITHWEETVRNSEKDDATLRKVRAGTPLDAEEEASLARRLNRPELYFNEDNLRRAYRRPNGNLVDFIRAALGSFKLKGKDEELAESFGAWLVTKSFTPEQASYLNLLKNRGIAKGRLAMEDLFQPPLSVLNAAALGVELFGESGLRSVITEINDAVFRAEAA